jgi:hypothetical protein
MIPLTVLTVPILREKIKHIYRVSVENLNDSSFNFQRLNILPAIGGPMQNRQMTSNYTGITTVMGTRTCTDNQPYVLRILDIRNFTGLFVMPIRNFPH